jgi:hypothetical protein
MSTSLHCFLSKANMSHDRLSERLSIKSFYYLTSSAAAHCFECLSFSHTLILSLTTQGEIDTDGMDSSTHPRWHNCILKRLNPILTRDPEDRNLVLNIEGTHCLSTFSQKLRCLPRFSYGSAKMLGYLSIYRCAHPYRPFLYTPFRRVKSQQQKMEHCGIYTSKKDNIFLGPTLHMPALDLPTNLGPSVYKISPVEGRVMGKVSYQFSRYVNSTLWGNPKSDHFILTHVSQNPIRFGIRFHR